MTAIPALGFLLVSPIFLFAALQQEVVHAAAGRSPCFPALFVFGNSLSDTGNGVLTGNLLFRRASQLPYGETFPGHPTGRFSDGRLLVDFLADFLGLPPINPYLDSGADFSRGVNYAVDGARTLNNSFLRSQGVITTDRDFSLGVQVGWHISSKTSEHSNKKPSQNAYANGLYVIEFGGNDYISALGISSISPMQVSSQLVPLVIRQIGEAIELLYRNGARHFLLIAITPIGCSPLFLATSQNAAKDGFGCLKDINSLSQKHGTELRDLARHLRVVHPDATFVTLDYYGAFTNILENNGSYGFTNTLDACCGAGLGSPNNFNVLLFCNKLTYIIPSALCQNPNAYLNWDGIHFTDKFNSKVFDITIGNDNYLDPPHSFSMCK